MSDHRILWQVTDGGVREVSAVPCDAQHTQWVVSPVGGGAPETVSAADLAPTDEVALLLWHGRRGDMSAVDELTAVIGARYRGLRVPVQREPGSES